MPYIGRAATNAGSVNYLDDISSGFDGSDTTFTCAISGTTITPGQENVYLYLDGVFQHPTDAYSISGSTITFTEAPASGVAFTGYVAGEGAYLDDGTVSTAKLDDDAVTASKLDDDGTGFQVGDLGVGGSLTSGDKLTVTGRLRASGGIIGDLTGDVIGNVTGNTSGTAATVTGAAQTNITSLGTLTSLTTSGSTGSNYIGSFTNTSATGWGLFVKGGADNADYALRVQDKDAGDLLSVKAGGRTGVGTNDPTDKFQINYDADFYEVFDGAGTWTTKRGNGSTGGKRIVTDLSSGSWGTDGGYIEFKPRNSTAMTIAGDGNSTFAGDLTISNSIPLIFMNDTSGAKNNQIIFQAGASNIFRIGTDITTNNGTQLLQVTDGGGNTSSIEVNSSGFVGIQSNDTSGDLNLAGSFGAPLHILQKPSSQGYGLVVQGNSNANGARIGIGEADSNFSTRANVIDIGFDSSTDFIFSRTGKDMIFGVNSAERMRITSGGNQIIGTGDRQYDWGSERRSLTIKSVDNAGANNYSVLEIVGHSINNDGALGAIHFYDHTSSNASIQANRQNNSGSAKLMFATSESGGSKKERMTIYDSGTVQFRDGISFKGTNGNNPSGDEHHDVPIKMVAYRKTVSSTDVSNGYIDFDTDIYRDNIISGITNHFGAAATNVNNIGYNPGYGHSLHFYAGGGCRLYFGSSVAQNDKMGIVLFFTGNTG